MNEKEKRFQKYGEEVVLRLRRIANEAERELQSNSTVLERTQAVIHAVTWGVANLQLELLVKQAGRVMEDK